MFKLSRQNNDFYGEREDLIMGQRSQIFVRYEDNGDNKEIIARYFGWNYSERMISRVRYGIEWILENIEYKFNIKKKMHRILETNFDMIDVVISADILEEFKDYDWECTLNEYMFETQANNDGKCLIDITSNGIIKYAFLDSANEKIMNASEYMDWDCDIDWKTPNQYREQEIINTCITNITEIEKMAVLMSEEDVKEFMQHDYSYLIE